jgi:hypothetical protein
MDDDDCLPTYNFAPAPAPAPAPAVLSHTHIRASPSDMTSFRRASPVGTPPAPASTVASTSAPTSASISASAETRRASLRSSASRSSADAARRKRSSDELDGDEGATYCITLFPPFCFSLMICLIRSCPWKQTSSRANYRGFTSPIDASCHCHVRGQDVAPGGIHPAYCLTGPRRASRFVLSLFFPPKNPFAQLHLHASCCDGIG